MVSSTFAAPSADGSATPSSTYTSSTYTAANLAANLNQWRPNSARSARSRSPLVTEWMRRQQAEEDFDHQQVQPHQQMEPPQQQTQSGHHLHTNSTHIASLPLHHDEYRPSTDRKRSSGSFRLTMTTRSGSIRLQRASGAPAAGGLPPPPLTREDFEALPMAIQRKYFSTLERLRFAQPSGMVDGIAQHYDDAACHNSKRRKARQDRSVSDHFSSRLRRRSLQASHFPPADPLWFDSLPDKIKKREFTREEQVVLAKHLRASVILDAADEAIYKIGRRASRNLSPDAELCTPTLSSRRNSMDSHESDRLPTEPSHTPDVPESFYDSFRWLDEEDDLDLRLFLDDYHANLREDLPLPTKERRPSFRRHLSISKIPFGRSSVPSSRPGTKDAAISPISPVQTPLANLNTNIQHTRRRSRTLSLIGNKHTPSESITTIDPEAAHYQDPEARLKLRVYLASPQKFDEAIEFGFPSKEVLSAAPAIAQDTRSPAKRQSRQKPSNSSSNLRTFLADDDDDDDRLSLNSDPPSAEDPDSPKTPQAFEKPTVRPFLVSPEPVNPVKPSEAYAQVPASSREMTLRMTLTRPDLRACEDQIYGWKKPPYHATRRSQSSPLREELATPVQYLGEANAKQSIERVFAGIDHWNANPTDGGVMKRIWNRVRRA